MHATPSRRLAPSIRTYASTLPDKKDRAFVLAISDTGSGVSQEALPHVFEPFFSTKERGKGTGLGLSQVYGFAKGSGGAVDIDSKVGAGTTLLLYFPEAKPADIQVSNDAAIVKRGFWWSTTTKKYAECGCAAR